MKGYHHLNQERINEILRVYQETQSTAATAELLGLKVRLVGYHVKQAGLQLTGYRRTACWQNRDLVISLIEQGATLEKIAQQVGTNRSRVKEFLERYGLDRKPLDQSGENNPNWKGGRMVEKGGYVLVFCPDHPNCNRHGYMREHRLVMEQKLGRYLGPKEVVHHIDKNPQNNAIENLKLYDSNRDHLAEELEGQVPNWTEEGRQRIQEGIAHAVANRRKSSRRP